MPKVSDDSSGEARRQQAALDRESEAYRQKRERNNLAVKKSREKSRQKTSETSMRVALLRAENDELEHKVDGLTKELSIMKELLLAHARGGGANRTKTEPTSSSTTQAAQRVKAEKSTAQAAPRIKDDPQNACAPALPDHEYFGSPEAAGSIEEGDVYTEVFAMSDDVYLEEYVVE